ncbi:MAG TPA: PrsW family intramembrane metalloprotease [Ktedonobacterales bacterium]
MTKEFCQRCGAEIPEGAQSCPVCGAQVSAAALGTASFETAPREESASQALTPNPPFAPATPAQYAPYPTTTGVWATTTQPSYPGYPGYPAAGAYTPYPQPNPQPYPQPYPPAGGYGQPGAHGYGYPWPYSAPYYAPPVRPAPGETYARVISWIVTIASGLAVVGGLLVTALASLGVITGEGNDLSFLGSIIGFSLAPIVGGAFGLWYGIGGIRRRPSPRFSLPPAWAIFAMTLVAIGGGLALWQYDYSQSRAPGTAVGMLPLVALAGALPALAILAFTSQRLRNPSTRRHVWMSLFYGMTLAPLCAVIIETILSLIIVSVLHLSAQDAQSVLGQPNVSNPSPTLALAMFLVLSVVAPLVEEGVKPLGALLAIRRLRTPGEAFLVGLAAGVGFDVLETIGYIGQGQADWISVAIERIGAGLLHGVGAGMGALGWYYLVNGSGVRLRWLRGIGCGVYAIVQHGLFNALSLFDQALPTTISDWLNQPFFVGGLPLQYADALYLFVYLLILSMLIFMTWRLWNAKGMPERKPPAPAMPPWPAPYQPYQPYYPYSPYRQYAPGGWVAPAPAHDAQQPMGGAR